MFAKADQVSIDLKRVLKKDASQAAYATPSFAMKDMRAAARKDVWCECTVSASGVAVREAVITDVSKSGARVRFRMRGSLPELVHIKAGRLGLNRLARVAWQTLFDAGLEFLEPGQTRLPPKVNAPTGQGARPAFGKKSA